MVSARFFIGAWIDTAKPYVFTPEQLAKRQLQRSLKRGDDFPTKYKTALAQDTARREWLKQEDMARQARDAERAKGGIQLEVIGYGWSARDNADDFWWHKLGGTFDDNTVKLASALNGNLSTPRMVYQEDLQKRRISSEELVAHCRLTFNEAEKLPPVLKSNVQSYVLRVLGKHTQDHTNPLLIAETILELNAQRGEPADKPSSMASERSMNAAIENIYSHASEHSEDRSILTACTDLLAKYNLQDREAFHSIQYMITEAPSNTTVPTQPQGMLARAAAVFGFK